MPFELVTDHKPLEAIYTPKSKPCARIERWVLRLQPYNFRVVYKPGSQNIADCLSRLTAIVKTQKRKEAEDYVKFVAQAAIPGVALTARDVERASAKDPELQELEKCIRSGKWEDCRCTRYKMVRDELCMIGKLILRGTRIVIPQCLRKSILELAHEGHQGIVKTKQRRRTKVWWPGIDKEAEALCRRCHGCQLVGPGMPPEPMQRTTFPDGPWQDLAADLLGPLPSGEYLFVVVSYFSRFFETRVMRSTTSRKVVNSLERMFSRHGMPLSLKTDNGPQFSSDEFSSYLLECGIEHRYSTPLWPRANGEVELQNRSLLKAIKVACVEKKNWQNELN